MFRIARGFRTSSNAAVRGFGRLVCLCYLIIVEWTWGIELPWGTEVGPRLRIYHGTGLVVNANTKIGCDVVLRQGVCIGARTNDGGAPRIGDRVSFGANSMVLGGVHIGDDALIGAGAVVLADVSAGRSVVGNPARSL
ncbi:serine O-acetyltransferase [Cryobacterium sp. HLT2-28]|uniref:serine O-acetyltransferase n=1 Tax=Cryobacterium sp. HLT2-28 TaxID=1259146 RepID=UPI00351341A0